MEEVRMKPKLIYFSLILILLVCACGEQADTPTANLVEPTNTISSLLEEAARIAALTQQAGGQSEATRTNQPEETPAPVTITHQVTPGDPGESNDHSILDADSYTAAFAKCVQSSDEVYDASLFERPFKAETFDWYYPEVDILQAQIVRETQWVYLLIELKNKDGSGQFSGFYGAEIDLDVDGRGDLLIFGGNPGSQWSTGGVEVWQDSNGDVGGSDPLKSESSVGGNGYEQALFRSGVGSDADLAWARMAPDGSPIVQLAFKTSLLQDDKYFMWGVLAQKAAVNPGKFDIVDHYPLTDAGSPVCNARDYPLKTQSEMDNTCRLVVGISPSGNEPRLCASAMPSPTPTPTSKPESNSGSHGSGGSTTGSVIVKLVPFLNAGRITYGNQVVVYEGACFSGGDFVVAGFATNSVTFNDLPAGTYCAWVNPVPNCTIKGDSWGETTISKGQTGEIKVFMHCE
jgi:hypothetical protein